MTHFIADIPKRLKIARVASGYKTARELTEKYAIPASTYSQHENGKRTLSLENIISYSELFKVDPTWLITGQGDPCGEYGSKELEEKILAEQERLGQTGELDAYAIPTISLEHKYSMVNTSVLKKILLQLLPVLKQIPEPNMEESLDFCFDLYNKIIVTNADGEERSRIIGVCLESFFKGLGIRITDELLRKVAFIE